MSTIAPGIYSIAYKRGGRVHCFLVLDVDGITLIDTGYDEDAGPILAKLESITKGPQDIKRILLTHSHASHIKGLAAIARLSGAPVYAHEWEIPIIQGKRKAEKVGYDLPKPFNFEVYALQLGLNAGLGKHTPHPVDMRLKDGDKVGPLQVMSVPGHTPGSLAYWHSEQRILFTGDTVSSWPVNPEISWPSFDLDHDQAQRSVAKMAELSDVQIICCGHGAPITDGSPDVLKYLANKPLPKR